MEHDRIELDKVNLVTDEALIPGLKRLVRADQKNNAELLAHLGEVDSRGLYREHAQSSMLAYCVKELRMSEAEAYLRILAARLGRRFPRVLQLFAQGALNLTTIKLLAPHLTQDNHVHVLERARDKGKREIELLVAEIAPKPDVPNRIRKLPEPTSSLAAQPAAQSVPASVEPFVPTSIEANQAPSGHTASLELGSLNELGNAVPREGRGSVVERAAVHLPDGHARSGHEDDCNSSPIDASKTLAGVLDVIEPNRAAFVLEAPRPRGSSKPLSPGRYKVEFTAGQALHDKLAQLQDLLRHQVPDGDLAEIVERAVDVLIDQTMKRRFAQTRAPRKHCSPKPSKTSSRNSRTEGSFAADSHTANSRTANSHNSRTANSRYVPRAVVREVYQRDGGQCTFVSAEGKRCSERSFLQLHHHAPFARGGEATADNLRLTCRPHNDLFAERDFGRSFMRSKRTKARNAVDELGPQRPERVPSLIRSGHARMDGDRPE